MAARTAVKEPSAAARRAPVRDTPKQDGRRRVVIEGIAPEVDGGRFPAKRTVGDMVRVEADVFTDGHDAVAAMLLYRKAGSKTWLETRMQALVNDRWFG